MQKSKVSGNTSEGKIIHTTIPRGPPLVAVPQNKAFNAEGDKKPAKIPTVEGPKPQILSLSNVSEDIKEVLKSCKKSSTAISKSVTVNPPTSKPKLKDTTATTKSEEGRVNESIEKLVSTYRKAREKKDEASLVKNIVLPTNRNVNFLTNKYQKLNAEVKKPVQPVKKKDATPKSALKKNVKVLEAPKALEKAREDAKPIPPEAPEETIPETTVLKSMQANFFSDNVSVNAGEFAQTSSMPDAVENPPPEQIDGLIPIKPPSANREPSVNLINTLITSYVQNLNNDLDSIKSRRIASETRNIDDVLGNYDDGRGNVFPVCSKRATNNIPMSDSPGNSISSNKSDLIIMLTRRNSEPYSQKCPLQYADMSGKEPVVSIESGVLDVNEVENYYFWGTGSFPRTVKPLWELSLFRSNKSLSVLTTGQPQRRALTPPADNADFRTGQFSNRKAFIRDRISIHELKDQWPIEIPPHQDKDQDTWYDATIRNETPNVPALEFEKPEEKSETPEPVPRVGTKKDSLKKTHLAAMKKSSFGEVKRVTQPIAKKRSLSLTSKRDEQRRREIEEAKAKREARESKSRERALQKLEERRKELEAEKKLEAEQNQKEEEEIHQPVTRVDECMAFQLNVEEGEETKTAPIVPTPAEEPKAGSAEMKVWRVSLDFRFSKLLFTIITAALLLTGGFIYFFYFVTECPTFFNLTPPIPGLVRGF